MHYKTPIRFLTNARLYLKRLRSQEPTSDHHRSHGVKKRHGISRHGLRFERRAINDHRHDGSLDGDGQSMIHPVVQIGVERQLIALPAFVARVVDDQHIAIDCQRKLYGAGRRVDREKVSVRLLARLKRRQDGEVAREVRPKGFDESHGDAAVLRDSVGHVQFAAIGIDGIDFDPRAVGHVLEQIHFGCVKIKISFRFRGPSKTLVTKNRLHGEVFLFTWASLCSVSLRWRNPIRTTTER